MTSLDPLGVIRSPGGTCGNVAVILRRFGCEVTVLADPGDDSLGDCLREGLLREGIALPGEGTNDPVTRHRKSTGAVVEIVATRFRGGHRFVFTCPRCQASLRGSNIANRDQIETLSAHLNQFDVLFFDRGSPALVDLARRARQEELLLVFEPNHLSRGTRNEQAAVFSDVVKFSRESGVTASEWLPPRNASTRVVIETLGGDGLKYRLRGEHRRWSRWKHVPAIASANVVDTAGAGDWCTAGVIEELARTPAPIRWAPPSIERALAFGQALAAVSLSFHGPRGVLSETRATAIRRVARAASAAGAVSPASVLGLRNNATLPPLTVVEESRACALCLSPLETRGPNR